MFDELKYRGVPVLADCKRYAQYTVLKNGEPYALEHEFEGADVISYTSELTEDSDYKTIDELKKAIDDREV